ncbi:MAG: hypothetical protein GKR86_11535 [Ilumatobacter sp.]|nr:hypothetical protein [Ilumatobacter sp.]
MIGAVLDIDEWDPQQVTYGFEGCGGSDSVDVATESRNPADLTTKQSTGNLQLVPDTDRRPAVQAASQAFAGVVVLPYITVDTGEIE